MDEIFDVAIVGASLSGASAAISLGQAGIRTALIDKAHFPRRKPCGEGLSSYGLKQLELLGIKDSILNLPHVGYSGYRVRSGSVQTAFRSPWGESITIQRSILDEAVLANALAFSSVTGFFAKAVTNISGSTVEFENSTLRARQIIIASGGNSPLLRKIGCKVTQHGPLRAGVTATFKGEFSAPPEAINIILKKGFEIYCTPLAQGRLNLSILAPANTPLNLREVLLSPEVIAEAFTENSFNGVLELIPEGRVNIGNVRRSTELSSLILAGDAKEEFDPIGGMGMSHALCSGISAAKQAIRNLSATTQFNGSINSEEKELKQSASAMRLFTRICSGTFESAKKYPVALQVANSQLASALLKTLTRELI